MKKISFKNAAACLGLMAALALGGCATPKNMAYLQDLNESAVIINLEKQSIRVQPEDKISIIVHSKDPSLAALFNLPVVSANSRDYSMYNGTGTTRLSYSTSDGMSVYTVNNKGNIEFPVLGDLHVSGMTRGELAEFIKGELIGRNLVKDPTVIVEFVNTGVSVMGEVNRPGRYDINRDNINVLEMLALAGDLTIQGQRQNIKVLRQDTDGKTQVYTLDLTQSDRLMNSPAYFLKQNDIIYVEPNGVRKRQATVNGNTALSASFWVSVASLLTSVAVLIFK